MGITVTEVIRPGRTSSSKARTVPPNYKVYNPDTAMVSDFLEKEIGEVVTRWLKRLEEPELPAFKEVERFKFELVEKVMEISEGNASEGADILNMHRTTLLMKLKAWEKNYGWCARRNSSSGRNKDAHMLRQWKYLGLLS